MRTKVFFTTSLALVSLSAFGNCAKGLTPIREGARLQFLEVGSYITFNQDIEIPNFADTKIVTQTVAIYLDPKPSPRYLPKNKHYRIEKSSDYMIGTSEFELYFNPNESTTVGGLRDNTQGKIELCTKDSPRSAI